MRLAHLHFPNITPFARVSHLQETLTTRLLAHKKALPGINQHHQPDPTIITFTPNPVYTTGRRDMPPSNTCTSTNTNGSNGGGGGLSLPSSLEPIRSLLSDPNKNTNTKTNSNDNKSASAKAEYHPTLRGGQTTYHGPGQMVAYTVLDLRRLGLSPRCHIRVLENSVVDVLSGYGVEGVVTEDPGVWVPSKKKKEEEGRSGIDGAKKITAVGVHLRRNISSFGIGFNVTEEPMWFFRQIVACGLEGKEATSLEGQGVRVQDGVKEVAERFVEAFTRRINADFACGGGGASGERIEEVYSATEEDLLRS